MHDSYTCDFSRSQIEFKVDSLCICYPAPLQMILRFPKTTLNLLKIASQNPDFIFLKADVPCFRCAGSAPSLGTIWTPGVPARATHLTLTGTCSHEVSWRRTSKPKRCLPLISFNTKMYHKQKKIIISTFNYSKAFNKQGLNHIPYHLLVQFCVHIWTVINSSNGDWQSWCAL